MNVCKVACWNAHGLRYKQALIRMMMAEDGIDFLFISETWMTQTMYEDTNNITIGNALPKTAPGFGYHLGAALISTLPRETYEVHYVDERTIVWSYHGLQFTGEYIPPWSTEEDEERHMARLAAHEKLTALPTVWMGDFNMRLGERANDTAENRRASTIGAWFENNDFVIHRPIQESSSRFTFTGAQGNSIVDYVIVPMHIPITDYTHGCFTELSDHVPVLCSLTLPDIQEPPSIRQPPRKQWRMRRLDNYDYRHRYLLQARQELSRLDGYLEDLREHLPPETAADLWEDALNTAISCAAMKILGQKPANSQPRSPLMKNPQLKRIEKACKVLEKRIQRTFTSPELAEQLQAELLQMKSLRRQYATTARKVVRNESRSFHRRLNANPANILSKRLKQLRKRAVQVPSVFNDLNGFAASVSNQFRAIPAPPGTSEPIFEEALQQDQLHANHITEGRVSKAIQRSLSGKSPGPSGLPMDLVKPLRSVLSNPVSKFFSFLFATGVVPSAWTKAYIHPVPKVPRPQTPSQFRPIVLTETWRKLYEKTLKDALVAAVEPICPEQCGFRSGKSTLQQIATLNEDVIQFTARFGKPPTLAFLDIAKAYDCVDRAILWRALRARGIPFALMKALECLFDHNSLQVVHNGRLSTEIHPESGLLQGSCLSPILYSVYIDGIVEAIRANDNVLVYLFADDIALLTPNREVMQRALKRAEAFSYSYRFRFSPTKCIVLEDEQTEPITIYQQPIPEQPTFKYLGVLFTNRGVDWEAQFKRSAQQQRGLLNSFTSIGFHPRGFLPKTAEMVIKSFLRPVGEYALAIAPGKECYLRPLQQVQNETLRRMFGVGKTTSTPGMHLLADIPLIRDRHDALKSAFVANVQRQPPNSRVLKAFRQSQEKWIKDSCFNDIASLQLYRNYANWCRYIPHTQWNQLLAVWRSRLHQEQRLRLRTSYIRGGAFSQCVNLFTDLSHCRPSVARSIHRWVLGQLPHYPSGCRGCGAERIGQRHVLECLHINPDLAISLGFYELAALALRRMEGFLIA